MVVVGKQNLITAKKARRYYLEDFWKQRASSGRVVDPALLIEGKEDEILSGANNHQIGPRNGDMGDDPGLVRSDLVNMVMERHE